MAVRVSPNQEVREALKPFVAIFFQIHDAIVALDDDELALLDGKVGMFTETNCGWQEYATIRMIASEIAKERGRRRIAAETAE